MFCSCKSQPNTDATICNEKFKEARDLVYTYPASPASQSALDSALVLTNECLQCDSIRKAVVEFKITLLVALKKYSEGMSFVDSLKENDFTFNFKKKMNYKNFEALAYSSKNDTVQQKKVYREIANDLEQYIKERSINDKEFDEIYNYLFTAKENYLSVDQINKEVDSLQKVYPEKESFFEFFRK